MVGAYPKPKGHQLWDGGVSVPCVCATPASTPLHSFGPGLICFLVEYFRIRPFVSSGMGSLPFKVHCFLLFHFSTGGFWEFTTFASVFCTPLWAFSYGPYLAFVIWRTGCKQFELCFPAVGNHYAHQSFNFIGQETEQLKINHLFSATKPVGKRAERGAQTLFPKQWSLPLRIASAEVSIYLCMGFRVIFKPRVFTAETCFTGQSMNEFTF